MGFLNRMERRDLSLENPSTPLSAPAAWLVDWMTGGGSSAAGVVVNEQRAMAHATVISCVKILAETLAMMPLPLYRRLSPRGRERAEDHPLYTLLHDAPNPEITSFAFRETLQAHLGIRGNAYAEIERKKSGRILAFWPLTPSRVTPFRQDGEKRYRVELPNGSPTTLESDEVLHIPGFGYDGLQGLSPIGLARHSIGLSIAAEEYGSRWFGSGSRPGGVLTRPVGAPKLTDAARNSLGESFERKHGGLSNAHRVAILEEGMTWEAIGVNPAESQFLETRKYQRAEICGWYRVPPHLIADLDRSTNNNIEQQSLEFIVYTMQPWISRWEQTMNVSLLSEDERRSLYTQFNLRLLLRGDAAARAKFYSQMMQIGVYSPNDIRELEDENPTPDGNRYFVQGALVPLDSIDAFIKSRLAKLAAGGTDVSPPAPDPEENPT
jgi:HK97 family phage portal protein